MDTSDPNITFDADGLCDYCCNFESTSSRTGILMREAELTGLAQRIKDSGREDFGYHHRFEWRVRQFLRCLRGQGKDGVAPLAFSC